MGDRQGKFEGQCPHCGTRVDPLRAGAVSIVQGQIAHFCSPTCRELYLKREIAPPRKPNESARSSESEKGSEEPSSSAEVTSTEPEEKHPVPVWGGLEIGKLRLALPYLIELCAFILTVVALGLIPSRVLGGFLVPSIATAAVLVHLVMSILRERRGGFARIVESTTVPIAAAILVVIAAWGDLAKVPSMCAVGLLAAERMGRFIEILGRRRSGILDVIAGKSPTLLADEWRDNSITAARIRRVTIVLEWARFPVAVLIGLLVWLSAGSPIVALLAGAIALAGINPRALRMATGDVHMAVALSAVNKGIVIRDAHAVQRVASARVVLFLARRSLFLPTIKVVNWQTVEGEDEKEVMLALASLESRVDGRFAKAVLEFAKGMGSPSLEEMEVSVIPGKGVVGETSRGRLVCGTRGLLLDESIFTARYEDWAANVEKSGRRALFVVLDDRIVAMFGVEEEPAQKAMEQMRRLMLIGLDPAMVTSAEVDSAMAMGVRLGIENVKFETTEDDLDALIEEINATGDRVLLVGHGRAFETCLRSAEAGIAMGSSDSSMAGIDARQQGLEEVVDVISSIRAARASVAFNLVTATIAVMMGLGLASSWHYPYAVIVAGAFGFLSCALSTFNGPFVGIAKMKKASGVIYGRLRSILGLGRA